MMICLKPLKHLELGSLRILINWRDEILNSYLRPYYDRKLSNSLTENVNGNCVLIWQYLEELVISALQKESYLFAF